MHAIAIIIITEQDEQELRKLQEESLRSRQKKHPRVMHFWRDFEPHDLIDRLIARLDESKK